MGMCMFVFNRVGMCCSVMCVRDKMLMDMGVLFRQRIDNHDDRP